MSTAAQAARTCGPVGRLLGSTLGKKALMAVTGVVMFGFVVGHLIGNLQVFAGDKGAALDAYALFLKNTPALLWGTRGLIFVSLVLHVWAAVSLKRLSDAARPIPYKVHKDLASNLPARNMYWGGLSLLFYVGYHLMHFTIGVASPIATDFNSGHVYQNMVRSFQNPAMSAVYMLAMFALGMHLYHGLYSLFQTLGLNHPAYLPRIRNGARAFGALVAVGFCTIPVAILTGLVK